MKITKSIVVLSAMLCAICAQAAAKKPAISAELRRELTRYGMLYGECSRPLGRGSVVVRWVMYRPRATSAKLPVLVFFPGLGELGPDPARLFRNRGIFDIATSREFQRRHPCVFVALQTDAGVERHCYAAGRTNATLSAIAAALADALKNVGNLRIDRDRIYLTGLSAGGGACCSMICAYPGKFAAAMPISGVVHPDLLSPTTAENIWMMYNSCEYSGARKCTDFDALSREMAQRGGEFRVGELTGEGHNAWDAAWREEAAWDWLFSKRAYAPTGKAGAARASARSAAGQAGGALDRSKWKCTASARAESASTEARFGADGLSGTVYRSATAAGKGDWWQVEFPETRGGSMKLFTGDEKGRHKVLRGSVLLSRDGRRWTKAVAVHDGTASFRVDRGVKFVRLQIDMGQRDQFAVRELEVR